MLNWARHLKINWGKTKSITIAGQGATNSNALRILALGQDR